MRYGIGAPPDLSPRSRLRREAAGKRERSPDPLRQVGSAATAGGTDVDEASERASREVHGPGVRLGQCFEIPRGSDANDKVVAGDAATHMAANGEAQAAEHPDLPQRCRFLARPAQR